jgi:hypothetical protein
MGDISTATTEELTNFGRVNSIERMYRLGGINKEMHDQMISNLGIPQEELNRY